MSLTGTLSIAASALRASQLGLQTVGNNIANAGDENYTREVVNQSASTPQQIRPGMFVGTGVNVDSIERQVDDSVDQRLRASVSDSEGNASASQWMTRAEAVYNELSDNDLSTNMSTFFNGWSDLANKPQDDGLRQVVIQNGENLAGQIQSVRKQFSDLRGDLQGSVAEYAKDADTITQKIAAINKQISNAESGEGTANGLRDQRDGLLKDLAKDMNFTTAPGDDGMVNVFVGSEPLITGAVARGITVRNDTDPITGDVSQTLVFKDNDGTIPVTSGILGNNKDAMEAIDNARSGVDQLASSMIYELNKIHSSGQGLEGYSNVTSDNVVADPTAALNSDKADLNFKPTNGSFVVHVKDKATGSVTSTLVQVDLNGDGTDTTLNSLAGDIDSIANITATVTAGKLNIKTDSNAVEVSFSQDSSGTLASLGIGNFFTGSDGRDIAVNANIVADPRLLAAAKNGQPADNQTAKAISSLQTQALASLNGQSLEQTYQSNVDSIAAKVSGAKSDADSAQTVRDTLQSQRDSISGVSLDDEAISLMQYQRTYQASSRVIAATDDMLKQILALV